MEDFFKTKGLFYFKDIPGHEKLVTIEEVYQAFKQRDDKEQYNGKCCMYCSKKDLDSCPIKEAEPWSVWNNYCSEFIKSET